MADATKSTTATITVRPQVSVTIDPPSATVTSGTPRQFAAFISGTSNTAVTWSVTGPGSLSQTGLYQAPATLQTPATVTVRATSQADTTKSATAIVTIPAVGVGVSPISRDLFVGDSRLVRFTATVTNATNTEVTWSAPDRGSVTPQGNYTAPQLAGTYRLIATSVADTTKSRQATVSVDTEPPQR